MPRTQDELDSIREFIGEGFADNLQSANPSLVIEFIADLVYGDNQEIRQAKNKYKDHLNKKIEKAQARLDRLETEKEAARAELQLLKQKKQAEKDKL